MFVIFALKIISVLFIFILIIGIHELGHALAARFFSVRIRRISVGFGRPSFRKKIKNGCELIISPWLIGGYVNLLNSRIEPITKADKPFAFDKKPVYIRAIILSAGVVANFIVAFLFFVIFALVGHEVYPPFIKSITVGSIASKAGFKPNMRILQINNEQIISWPMAGQLFLRNVGNSKVNIKTETQNGVVKEITLNLSHWPPGKGNIFKNLGIKPDFKRGKEYIPPEHFTKAIVSASQRCINLLIFYYSILWKVITKTIPFTLLLGPLSAVVIFSESFIQSFALICYFVGTLSLAVGLINILPLPTLDGGSLIYLIYEKITGKPLSVAFEILLHRLVIIALVLIFIQLLLNDIQNYIAPAVNLSSHNTRHQLV